MKYYGMKQTPLMLRQTGLTFLLNQVFDSTADFLFGGATAIVPITRYWR